MNFSVCQWIHYWIDYDCIKLLMAVAVITGCVCALMLIKEVWDAFHDDFNERDYRD